MRHTVFVGLSGGVDSAVSAALLKERGFNVVGAFIKIWQPEFLECTWKEDRLCAMRVCAALEIPFREIDLSQEYKREVIDPMLESYARGETPNPDVLCNRQIKFGHFSAWAREQGAHVVATGHYARTREHFGHVELLRGVDAQKDQSYFLHRLQQRELALALFPVGGMTKTQVRQAARRFNLPVAQRPDSQGLCFVGDVSMATFLSRYISVIPGRVLDEAGRDIGEHHGAAFYTVGQRHGFSLTHAPGTPLYVIGVDVSLNTITVSPERMRAARSRVALMHMHWIHRAAALPLQVEVQARYRERPVPATIVREGEHIEVVFDKPHLAVPGQSLVLYASSLEHRRGVDEVCLGGGIISA